VHSAAAEISAWLIGPGGHRLDTRLHSQGESPGEVFDEKGDIFTALAPIHGTTVIIHPILNRSVTLPKRGGENVLLSGICTSFLSGSRAKVRSASVSCASVNEREKP
jgi:hypothetical protein